MERILLKLSEALQEANALIGEYKKKLHELAGLEAEHGEKVKSHEGKAADLAQREAAIIPVENLREAHRKLDEREARISNEQEGLDAQKQAFNSWKDEQKQLIENQRLDLAEQQKNLDASVKNINSEVMRKLEAIVRSAK